MYFNPIGQWATFDVSILEIKIVRKIDYFSDLGNSENKQGPSISSPVFGKGSSAENLLSKQLLGECF